MTDLTGAADDAGIAPSARLVNLTEHAVVVQRAARPAPPGAGDPAGPSSLRLPAAGTAARVDQGGRGCVMRLCRFLRFR